MGRDKALLTLDGETLLARAVRLLSTICNEVLVIGPRKRAAAVPGTRVVPDEQPGAGPLGGIATALRAMHGKCMVAVATDMPLLNPALLRFLLDQVPGYDAVVPYVAGRTQQLHAVYTRTCLPAIDDQLAQRDFKVARLFERIRVRLVEEDEVRAFDPELLSFRNVNTEADWQDLLRLVHPDTSRR